MEKSASLRTKLVFVREFVTTDVEGTKRFGVNQFFLPTLYLAEQKYTSVWTLKSTNPVTRQRLNDSREGVPKF